MSNYLKRAHRPPGGGEKKGERNNEKMGRLFNFIFHWIVAKHWNPNRSIVPGVVKQWNGDQPSY